MFTPDNDLLQAISVLLQNSCQELETDTLAGLEAVGITLPTVPTVMLVHLGDKTLFIHNTTPDNAWHMAQILNPADAAANEPMPDPLAPAPTPHMPEPTVRAHCDHKFIETRHAHSEAHSGRYCTICGYQEFD